MEDMEDMVLEYLKTASEQVEVNQKQAQFCVIVRNDKDGNKIPQVATLSDRSNHAVLQGVTCTETEKSDTHKIEQKEQEAQVSNDSREQSSLLIKN